MSWWEEEKRKDGYFNKTAYVGYITHIFKKLNQFWSHLSCIVCRSCREPEHQSVPYHYYEPRGPDECAMYISHERGRRGSHHRFITEKRVFAKWARTFDIHFYQPDWSPPPLPANHTAEGAVTGAPIEPHKTWLKINTKTLDHNRMDIGPFNGLFFFLPGWMLYRRRKRKCCPPNACWVFSSLLSDRLFSCLLKDCDLIRGSPQSICWVKVLWRNWLKQYYNIHKLTLQSCRCFKLNLKAAFLQSLSDIWSLCRYLEVLIDLSCNE